MFDREKELMGMTNVLLIIVLGLVAAGLVLHLILLFRKVATDLGPIEQTLQSVEKSYERTERSVKEEIARNREEATNTSRQSREELTNTLKGVGDSLQQQLLGLRQTNDQKLERLRETVEQRLQTIQEESTRKLEQVRQDSVSGAKNLREEVGTNLKRFNESLISNIGEMGRLQKGQLDVFSERLDRLTQKNDEKLGAMRDTIEQRLGAMQEDSGKKLDQMRQESSTSAQRDREEVTTSLKEFSEILVKTLNEMGESNQQKFDGLKTAVEEKLKAIQEDNAKQLEQMRATVDEKLQGTLERRLSESFKQVSERLEQVYKGLGEMQALATGVGDLKKVLTNVKTRGTWGEVQLGAMLEQVLTPEQYALNVATKDGGERVEFAVKLPGRGEDKDEIVWLPIDAKFPVEDYQRLMDAQEKADPDLAEVASKQLENRIKQCASDICGKYLNPPRTTDFGILFLPTEGLFAEVIRRSGLTEYVQRECRVVIAGPTTLWSILNSLQLGFKTLAIQKRSSEVWNLLAAVKTDWTKYGEILDKVQKKLHEASDTIEKAQARTRVIGRKLKNVQELPASEAQTVLMIDSGTDNLDDEPSEN
jgi:DNA recombination protein RmuC